MDITVESELEEPKVCGRCSKAVENLFDSESCDHGICVDCRFKDDVQCLFCTSTKHEEKDSTNKRNVTSLGSFLKKKLINKEHIIDIKRESFCETKMNRIKEKNIIFKLTLD